MQKAYHAGLNNDRKNEVFNDFVYEKIDIVVCHKLLEWELINQILDFIHEFT